MPLFPPTLSRAFPSASHQLTMPDTIGVQLVCTIDNTALELSTEPPRLVTNTVYVPSCTTETLGRTKDEFVAPARGLPSNCHWKEGGGRPVTVAAKYAVVPAATVSL